jgi:hypothetical protein
MDQHPIQGSNAPSRLMLQKPGWAPDWLQWIGLGKKPSRRYLQTPAYG